MGECRRTAERLTPYVDEALPPGERADVERHLDACPPCRDLMTEERGGRLVLRECADKLRSEPLPPGLRSRCEAIAREHARVRVLGSWRTRLVPATLVALLVIFTAMLLLSVATRRSDAVLAAQLTADHVKCFKVFADPEKTADAETVERELASRYGWRMTVPPSSTTAGLRLLGARRCAYAEGVMPHVMYRADGTSVSLFKLEGITRHDANVATLGYRCHIWSRGADTFVLVAPESAWPEMTKVSQYVEQQAR
jgi:anti-sigma factor RsiW